jgi:hypothetical protein
LINASRRQGAKYNSHLEFIFLLPAPLHRKQ